LLHDDASIRAALTQLYAATSWSRSWINQVGWLDPATPVCEWHGVSCSADSSTLTGLDLHFNDLTSDGCVDVTPIFAQLPDLETLNLSQIDLLCLDGLDLRGHSQLRSLALAGLNSAAGHPLLLPDPSRLVDLDLSLSSWNFNLSSSMPLLETLNLNGLKQPFDLSSIYVSPSSALSTLKLESVDLRGSLADLCPLPNLSFLSTNHAVLSGTLPVNVTACWPNIVALNLCCCNLNGPLPSFSRLPKLFDLRQSRRTRRATGVLVRLSPLSSSSLFGFAILRCVTATGQSCNRISCRAASASILWRTVRGSARSTARKSQ
jgi:hypothetical protein